MIDKRIEHIRNIPEILNLTCELYSNLPVLLVKDGNREVMESYREFNHILRKVADFLETICGKHKIIVIPGDMSREWLYVYFGILYSGNIAVPLDFVSEDCLEDKLKKLKPDLILTDQTLSADFHHIHESVFSSVQKYSLVEICEKADNNRKPGKIRNPIDPDQTAMLVFTSGTTGNNKIVEITHRNLSADAYLAQYYLGTGYDVGTRVLTPLPLHHIYAVTSCIVGPIIGGFVICVGEGVWKLKTDIQFFRPHLLMVVPMIVNSFIRKLFPDLSNISSEQIQKAKAFFGGKLRILYSGGAPLSGDYYGIMTLLGIFLVNGYGITECSPIVSYDNEEYHREGSVGKTGILPEISSVKLIDGEICVKGEIVSPGYWKEPELNKMVYDDDGWFHTGDLGRIDDDGYLFITGRKKNILILPDGNNISLDELEKQLAECPSVEAAIVLGKEIMNNPLLVAVVVTKKETGLSGEELEKQIEEEIEEINRKNPRFKRISMVRLLNTDFERTALGKVRKFKYEI